MGSTVAHGVSVAVAVAAGSGAGFSAYLSWRVFRDSPVAHVMGALALTMGLMTLYHVLLVVIPDSAALAVMGGGKYLALLGVLGLLVSLQRRTTISLREYDSSLLLAVAGASVFISGGLIAELLAPTAVHWAHVFGAGLILVGGCRLAIRDSMREHWFDALVADPDRVRSRATWMNPVDDRILKVCATSELVLTPAIIAYNIDYSREEVNRRLSELERHSLVERVERGKYRITPAGHQYLYGFETEREDNSPTQ